MYGCTDTKLNVGYDVRVQSRNYSDMIWNEDGGNERWRKTKAYIVVFQLVRTVHSRNEIAAVQTDIDKFNIKIWTSNKSLQQHIYSG